MQRPTSVPTRPFLLALALTGLGVGLAYWLVGAPPLVGAEDAAIGFRYARNFALGEGIVFNPGGERVEGFTSLLWLFLSAGVYRVVGEAALEPALFVISVGLTVAAVTIVTLQLFERVSGWAARGAGVVWLAGQAGFYFWAGLSLMDVAPWAAALAAFFLLIVLRLEGRPTWPGALPLVVIALTLIRPESMLVVPALVVVTWMVYGNAPGFRRLATEILGTVVLAVGALTAFRLAYFGYPLPNTYYVKVSPDVTYRLSEGVRYVAWYVRDHPISLVAAAAVVGCFILALALRARPGVHESVDLARLDAVRVAAVSAGLIGVGFVSVVYGGGDHYQGHRFLQGYLPLAAIPIGVGVAELVRRTSSRPLVAHGLGAAIIVGCLALLPSEWRTFERHNLRHQAFDVGLQGRFVAITLNQVFEGERPPELGLWMVGGAGYAYDGPVKDLLGLNWKAMGTSPGDRKGIRDHAAFNVDVFWTAPPELMMPEPQVVLGGMRCIRIVLGGAMRGLLSSARFEREFEPVRIQRGDSEPLIAYAREDWLRTAPDFVQPLGWAYCGVTPG